MKLTKRSYPHPVLGNGDDVPGAAFQTTCEVSSDKQTWFFAVTVQCSSRTLNRMLAEGAAAVTMHVECSNTMYRRAIDVANPPVRLDISADLLNGPVEVNCVVRATRDVNGYRIDGAHGDYGGATFGLRAGDILAIGESITFEAESHDTLRRIGSIMDVVPSGRDGDHPMRVDYEGEKIHIQLCKDDFELYRKLKMMPLLASHLTTTIVLPVLTEALYRLKGGDDSDQETSKWRRTLRARLPAGGIADRDDLLGIAQDLLEMPVRRALASAAAYAAGN